MWLSSTWAVRHIHSFRGIRTRD